MKISPGTIFSSPSNSTVVSLDVLSLAYKVGDLTKSLTSFPAWSFGQTIHENFLSKELILKSRPNLNPNLVSSLLSIRKFLALVTRVSNFETLCFSTSVGCSLSVREIAREYDLLPSSPVKQEIPYE